LFAIVTVAFGITESVGSTTVPTIDPYSTCARPGMHIVAINTSAAAAVHLAFISSTSQSGAPRRSALRIG
jgi:hypothetical protein